ncbi:MAG: NADH-quinone oxidoreductase subunit H [Candidatus Altiarchaeota archaeon]|nr:NADH-quinone oxidoreductase subunit H [Candidatus Altiarchaeota archaeon]
MVYEPAVPFLFEWIYRKTNALVQRRHGPPLLQPIYDFIKLFKKEVIVPKSDFLFLIAPPALFVINTAALFIALNTPENALLMLLVLFLVDIVVKTFMAYSVKSPFTMQGASRLMSLKMALDPAFPLAFLAPAFVFGFSIPWPTTAIIFFPLALIVSLAELEFPPFHIPTAESEIAGGWKTELSGILLAIVNYSEYAKAVAISALLASFFGPSLLLLKSVGIFIIISLLSAVLPRFSVNKAIKYLTILNIIAMLEVVISLSLVS